MYVSGYKVKKIETEKHDSDIEIVKTILKTLRFSDSEELAQRLMRRFGSFGGIFRAANEDLIKVEGMSETSAAFFSSTVAQFRQALRRAAKDVKPTGEYELVYLALALDNGGGEKRRIVVYADADDKILKYENSVGDDAVKKTVGTACGLNAASIATIEYGRHEKRPVPDSAALKFLSGIIKPLETVGIRFIDHIDFIGHKFCSLRRAIAGDPEYKEPIDASNEKYEAIPCFSDILSEYIKTRDREARIASLDKPETWRR